MMAKRVQLAFAQMAQRAANMMGLPGAFAVAVCIVLVWAATGPIFHFSDTWQLVINTGTTIFTFLVGFLICYSQKLAAGRDAIQEAHNQAQTRRMERMEREHGEQLKALHQLLADLHTHTTCLGHTTIGQPPYVGVGTHTTAAAPMVPVTITTGTPTFTSTMTATATPAKRTRKKADPKA